jgi:hypothetical protein
VKRTDARHALGCYGNASSSIPGRLRIRGMKSYSELFPQPGLVPPTPQPALGASGAGRRRPRCLHARGVTGPPDHDRPPCGTGRRRCSSAAFCFGQKSSLPGRSGVKRLGDGPLKIRCTRPSGWFQAADRPARRPRPGAVPRRSCPRRTGFRTCRRSRRPWSRPSRPSAQAPSGRSSTGSCAR